MKKQKKHDNLGVIIERFLNNEISTKEVGKKFKNGEIEISPVEYTSVSKKLNKKYSEIIGKPVEVPLDSASLQIKSLTIYC